MLSVHGLLRIQIFVSCICASLTLPVTSKPLEHTPENLAWEEWIRHPGHAGQERNRKVSPKSIFILPPKVKNHSQQYEAAGVVQCADGEKFFDGKCIQTVQIDRDKLIISQLANLIHSLPTDGNGDAPSVDYDYEYDSDDSPDIIDLDKVSEPVSVVSISNPEEPLKVQIFLDKFPVYPEPAETMDQAETVHENHFWDRFSVKLDATTTTTATPETTTTTPPPLLHETTVLPAKTEAEDVTTNQIQVVNQIEDKTVSNKVEIEAMSQGEIPGTSQEEGLSLGTSKKRKETNVATSEEVEATLGMSREEDLSLGSSQKVETSLETSTEKETSLGTSTEEDPGLQTTETIPTDLDKSQEASEVEEPSLTQAEDLVPAETIESSQAKREGLSQTKDLETTTVSSDLSEAETTENPQFGLAPQEVSRDDGRLEMVKGDDFFPEDADLDQSLQDDSLIPDESVEGVSTTEVSYTTEQSVEDEEQTTDATTEVAETTTDLPEPSVSQNSTKDESQDAKLKEPEPTLSFDVDADLDPTAESMPSDKRYVYHHDDGFRPESTHRRKSVGAALPPLPLYFRHIGQSSVSSASPADASTETTTAGDADGSESEPDASAEQLWWLPPGWKVDKTGEKPLLLRFWSKVPSL